MRCYSHYNQKRPVILAFFCAFAFLMALAGCEPGTGASPAWQFTGNTMGTTYSIKAVPAPEVGITEQGLHEEVEALLVAINQSMSTYIDDSELSLLNKTSADEWVTLSEPLFDVIEVSQKVSQDSGGAFDITLAPLIDLWGFGPSRPGDLPSQSRIEAELMNIGYTHLSLDAENKRLRKDRPLTLDLSSVAKGYATDLVADLLESHGLVRYMVEIGGEIKMRGHSPSERTWRIGIEKPVLGRSGAVEAVTGDDIAIATSGEYRNYYEKDGVRVSHTLDPSTGRPITHRLASVTVIHESGGYADAYATAINVLGPDKGYALAEREKLAAFFIVRNGDAFEVKYTEQFKQYKVQ